MRRVIAVALALALTACGGGDFNIGPTTVRVKPEAATFVWPDLPEALAAMQRVPGVPKETWDTTVWLVPPWHPVGLPGHACQYRWSLGTIQARTYGERTTADGCLGHEFAHRWQHLEDGTQALTSSATRHGPKWRAQMNQLNEAARTTWLHR